MRPQRGGAHACCCPRGPLGRWIFFVLRALEVCEKCAMWAVNRPAPGSEPPPRRSRRMHGQRTCRSICSWARRARAALRFPQNANVAATVALAGIGFEETRVRLVADPRLQVNQHAVQAEGSFGRFEMTVCGSPHGAQPKDIGIGRLQPRPLPHPPSIHPLFRMTTTESSMLSYGAPLNLNGWIAEHRGVAAPPGGQSADLDGLRSHRHGRRRTQSTL